MSECNEWLVLPASYTFSPFPLLLPLSLSACIHTLASLQALKFTPLHIAIRMDDSGLIASLLSHGADIRMRTKANQTAIDLARSPEVKLLLEEREQSLD
mmetsp:Transcript_15400/g.31261  ORF Transcript_15400/g.31261 Transcript_15400/m.31261 type:complete len:99 (+) Transcript_15400:167-463(+)